MVARRVILQGGLVLPLAAACGPEILRGNSGAVRVAVSWSGNELAAFRKVLAGLAASHTFTGQVEVVPLGDDIDTALSAGGRDAPDIIMLPDPGPIQQVADTMLAPLPQKLWAGPGQQPRYSPFWHDLLWHTDCHRRTGLYGIPFKSANMSLVWYDKSAFDGYDAAKNELPEEQRPDRWSLAQWHEQVRMFAGRGRHLLALGAADGWVLAYHFANVLRAVAPQQYLTLSAPVGPADGCSPAKSAWAYGEWRDPRVQLALQTLGEIWCVPGAFAGGVAEPLRRQFPDAVRDVFQHRHAAMVVAPDYAESVVRECIHRTGRDMRSVGVFGFPGYRAGDRAPNIAGGDVMVMTRYASDRARNLIAALAKPDAAQPWITTIGGFVPPNLHATAPKSYGTLFEDVAATMGTWDVFDFADLVGPRGRRDGLWFILTRFLSDVGGNDVGVVESAVGTALDRLTQRWR